MIAALTDAVARIARRGFRMLFGFLRTDKQT